MESARGLMLNFYKRTDLFNSVMRRAVHGIPSVMREMEFIAGLMKARQVVIPERMPMTILNLDLVINRERQKEKNMEKQEKSSAESLPTSTFQSKCVSLWI